MSDLSGIQQRLQATRTKIEQNNNAIGQNQGNISTNEADISQNKNDIAGNASAVDANNSAIESTKSSIASVESELSSVSGKKSGVQESIQGLKAKLDNPDIDDATRNQIEGDIKSQEMSFADFEKMEADLTRQKTELENKKAEQEQQGTQLKAEGEQFAQKGVDLSQTQTQLKDESATLEQTRADLASEEQQIQAEYEAAKNEPEVITEEVNGKKITKEIDPETGRVLKATEEENGKTVTSEFGEDGKVKAKTATSADGNTAVYDGKGNTVITVKAGESAGQIYDKFYAGDNNAENKENLINQFRNQVRTKDGEKIAADYNPSEKELQTFFNQKAGFTPDGTKMKDGGVLQAGQELKIPTEIDPDNVNLQGRDASVEKAKGNAAETRNQAIIDAKDAAKAQKEAEKAERDDIKNRIAEMTLNNIKIMDSETQRLNSGDGATGFGNAAAKYHNSNMQAAGEYLSEVTEMNGAVSSKDIARAAWDATTGYNGSVGKGTVDISESDVEDLVSDIQKLRQNPDDKILQSSVNERLNKFTLADSVKNYNMNRSENNLASHFLASLANDMTSGLGSGTSVGSRISKLAAKTSNVSSKAAKIARAVAKNADKIEAYGTKTYNIAQTANSDKAEGKSFVDTTVDVVKTFVPFSSTYDAMNGSASVDENLSNEELKKKNNKLIYGE